MSRVARFVRLASAPDTAEAAITVVDGMHGKGVATILLAELVRAARLRGIARFRADVIADNAPMRAILDRVGATPVASECEGGTIAYDLSLPELDAAAPRKSVLWILVEVLRGAAETMAVRFRARRL